MHRWCRCSCHARRSHRPSRGHKRWWCPRRNCIRRWACRHYSGQATLALVDRPRGATRGLHLLRVGDTGERCARFGRCCRAQRLLGTPTPTAAGTGPSANVRSVPQALAPCARSARPDALTQRLAELRTRIPFPTTPLDMGAMLQRSWIQSNDVLMRLSGPVSVISRAPDGRSVGCATRRRHSS
jgi:hypothetical protein